MRPGAGGPQPVKNGLNAEIAANAAARQFSGLVLTTRRDEPYNLAHTARRPLSARLRASEAPHLCVDRTSEKSSEVQISSASWFAAQVH